MRRLLSILSLLIIPMVSFAQMSDLEKIYEEYAGKEEAKYLTPDANGKYDTILSNFSQTSLYKMTFTNDGNNYVFTSSELVENE